MKTKITGKAAVFGRDDIDTDMIIPAKYLTTDDPRELAGHAMEFIDEDFPENVKDNNTKIVVAGKNFGCGSSREHAVWALTGNGIEAVIADSFARIFFSNCVNYGLFPVVCPGASKKIKTGGEVEIDIADGVVRTKDAELKSEPLPDFMMKIVEDGGLLPHVKKELDRKK